MEILMVDELLIPVLVEHFVVEFVDFHYLLLDVVFYLLIRHTISCSDCEGTGDEPVVYDTLGSGHKLVGCVRPNLQPNRVH